MGLLVKAFKDCYKSAVLPKLVNALNKSSINFRYALGGQEKWLLVADVKPILISLLSEGTVASMFIPAHKSSMPLTIVHRNNIRSTVQYNNISVSVVLQNRFATQRGAETIIKYEMTAQGYTEEAILMYSALLAKEYKRQCSELRR
jgi:hypothetical protein